MTIEQIPSVALRTGYRVLVSFDSGDVWMIVKEPPRLNEGVTAVDRQIHVRVHELDDPDECWHWGPSANELVTIERPTTAKVTP